MPKTRITLSTKMPADLACRQLLQPLFENMRRNEQSIRDDSNPEFLHDFRVAARSSRALFSQCRKLFPRDLFRSFNDEFKWLSEVTGPLRDAEVYLQQIPEFERLLPGELVAGLAVFRQHLEKQHQRHHKTVCAMLDSERYRDFCDNWQAFLQQDVSASRAPGIHTYANKRIRKMYRRTLKEGRAIDDASPDVQLHELRKTCKKLRYLLQYLQDLYAGKDIRDIVRELKKLQNHLGSFQDLSVQIQTLSHFNDTLSDSRQHAQCKQALARLIPRLQQRKHRLRQDFHRVFAGFDCKPTHTLFQRLLGA